MTCVLFLLVFDFLFVENPSNHTAIVGDAVSIKCVPPSSFPIQVSVRWYHNYRLITPGGSVSVDSSGTIKFTSIKKSDKGVYFCDGTNSRLHITRTSLPAYVTVLGKQVDVLLYLFWGLEICFKMKLKQ